MSQSIKAAIIMTAEYYGRQISETVLAMYASDLEDLPADKVCDAYVRYRRNPANKTFPLPAQIRELVNPEEFVSVETQAREVAARIVGAISRYGWANAKEAQAFIGPEGWDLVKRSGGWSYLCENTGVSIQPTTLQAQLRDQLEGTFRYGLKAVERSLEIAPRESNPQLESASEILKRISTGDEPEGAA